jgi:hypothetical protein
MADIAFGSDSSRPTSVRPTVGEAECATGPTQEDRLVPSVTRIFKRAFGASVAASSAPWRPTEFSETQAQEWVNTRPGSE